MIPLMHPENQSLTDPRRQLADLRQVVSRSEAAILSLQKLILVADGKIRTLETEVEGKRLTEPFIPRPPVHDYPITGLKMF